jgi:hypothetical protein
MNKTCQACGEPLAYPTFGRMHRACVDRLLTLAKANRARAIR